MLFSIKGLSSNEIFLKHIECGKKILITDQTTATLNWDLYESLDLRKIKSGVNRILVIKPII